MTVRLEVVVSADLGGAYGRGLLRGVSTYGAQARWLVHFGNIFEMSELPKAGDASCQGIIAAILSPEQVARVAVCGVPVVNVSDVLEASPVPKVVPDNEAVGRLAAEHFLDYGYRSFAYAPIGRHHYSDLRYQGFLARLREADPHCAPRLFGGDHRTDLPIFRGLSCPIGIFAANDIRARKLAMGAQEVGLRVPEDVAILGVDNDELICQTTMPPLSSVDVSAERVGFEAARLLDGLLDGRATGQGESVPPLVRVAPTGVVMRASSDQLAIADRDVAAAVKFIRDHFHEGLTVADVEAQSLLSRRSLERRFHEVLGRSPAAEIRRLQMAHAKRLLVESDLDMPAVAAKSGFRSAKQFSETFAEQAGMPPTRYRQQFQRR